MSTYADVLRYRELFGNLFRRDLQAKYRGSALGVLWTVANPVMLMAVYLLVFGVVWNSPFASGGHYSLFLLSGLVLWTFFAAAVQSSTRSMLDNANLIRKTRFPRQLVPLSVVFAHLVSFVSGIALAAASLNVLFRDVEFIVSALLVPWFFLTPILYPLGSSPLDTHHTVVQFIHWANPLSPAVEAVRAPLFAGTMPFWGDVVYLVVACGAALALGAAVFNAVDDQIAIEV
jgi:homopolymeric O-antigen transport system permease protein